MSLRTGVEYAAAVYIIVWVTLLGYMWLIGQKLARLQREVERLEDAAPNRADPAGRT